MGYSYHQVSQKLLSKHAKQCNPAYSPELLLSTCEEIAANINMVIDSLNIIQYIDFLPYINLNRPLLITLMPLFDEKDNLVAIKSLGTYFHPFGLHDYFSDAKVNTRRIINSDCQEDCQKSKKINLTLRQRTMLSLALMGYSQTEIATTMQVSRGCVAATFRDSLCPKFEVGGNSMQRLIDKARLLGFDRDFPMSLFEPQIITLQQY